VSLIWRIAVEPARHAANDLSGNGAKITGGRWNSTGTPMIYGSANIALATLETVISLRNGKLPFNRYLVEIKVPDAVWATRKILDPLPGGWDAMPWGLTGKLTGDAWVRSAASALLMVPSVMVPEEFNVLINPLHADAANIAAQTLKRWHYDPRFFA
jgi:RES domain-containing protein